MWQELYAVAYRYLRSRGVSHADAEDLAQETLIAAFQHIDGVKSGSVQAWIRVVARNRLVSRLRAQAKADVPADLDLQLAADDASDPMLCALKSAERRELASVLGRLADRDRELLELRYVHDMPVPEIAGRLGDSVNTVKVGLYRARQRLRVAYEEVTGS